MALMVRVEVVAVVVAVMVRVEVAWVAVAWVMVRVEAAMVVPETAVVVVGMVEVLATKTAEVAMAAEGDPKAAADRVDSMEVVAMAAVGTAAAGWAVAV